MKTRFVIPECLYRESSVVKSGKTLDSRLKISGMMVIFMLVISIQFAYASGPGTTTGMALLRMSGPRANALGDAFTAMKDDITALEFNPGSLGTLEEGQVSLQHQTGLDDDAFSKILFGWRMPKGALGVSAGYYNSGQVTLFDGVNPERSVTAEEDWVATLGYGVPMGKAVLGASARYLSSRLAETYGDTAYSVHAGLQVPISTRMRVGLSGPLAQTQLQYAAVKEDLPKVYRVGLAQDLNMNLATGLIPLTLLFDVPYDADEEQFTVAGGIESKVGPMAVRAGYNQGADLSRFSLGAGFALSRINIDYSFQMVSNEFNSLHRVSFSMRFAPNAPSRQKVVLMEKPTQVDPNSVIGQMEYQNQAKGKTYVVKQGDTLKDISTQIYGTDRWGTLIFYDNRDKIKNPDFLPVGER